MKFEGDDGSLAYAKAAGIYLDGIEAPLFAERVIRGPSRKAAVILAFGQSNAANTGEGQYVAGPDVSVFNVFDMRFYRAADPLPGASNNGAAVWGRVGDKLIAAGIYRSIVVVPIAVGGSYIQNWAPGGDYFRRLMFAAHRLKLAGLHIDHVCWHQGEAEANLTDMSAAKYRSHFLSIVTELRGVAVKAPIYVAIATLCETADHPFKNREQIRSGQKSLVSMRRGIRPGPDTDEIGLDGRVDGCHFSLVGLERHAQAWFDALTVSSWRHCLMALKYHLMGIP